MVILIGGHSSIGKTLMSQTLLEKYKIPYYSIDHLKMGIFRSNPDCGFTPTDSNDYIAKKLWPILKGMIMTSIENKQNLIIEGCYLLPEFINDFGEDYINQIIPVFFGFSKVYIEEKFQTNILAYRSVFEERLYEEERPIENFIAEHRKLKASCFKQGVKYFEINKDYNLEVNKVYDYIDDQRQLLLKKYKKGII